MYQNSLSPVSNDTYITAMLSRPAATKSSRACFDDDGEEVGGRSQNTRHLS